MFSKYMTVGRIVKTHGLKGEIKVKPYSYDIDNLLNLEKVFIDEREYKVISAREVGGMLYYYLRGIITIDDAELLIGKDLCILREDASTLEEGEYYIVDIIGCKVLCGGKELGVVKNIEQYGAADVYTVVGEKTVRFPLLKKIIINMDINKGIIELDQKGLDEVAVYED